MTPSGIEPATFQFVAQYLNHCATAVYIWEVPSLNQSQYTVVGIVTRVQGFEGARDFFLSLKTFRPGLGAHPASNLMGTVVLSRVVKWLGCGVFQLPPSRADNTCTPLYSFMVRTGTTLLLLTSFNLGQLHLQS
jgi:hypothetical protein